MDKDFTFPNRGKNEVSKMVEFKPMENNFLIIQDNKVIGIDTTNKRKPMVLNKPK